MPLGGLPFGRAAVAGHLEVIGFLYDHFHVMFHL
jgi:hypothetical protein